MSEISRTKTVSKRRNTMSEADFTAEECRIVVLHRLCFRQPKHGATFSPRYRLAPRSGLDGVLLANSVANTGASSRPNLLADWQISNPTRAARGSVLRARSAAAGADIRVAR